MSILQMFLGAAAGGDQVYVEDVFSTTLYPSNNSTLTVNTGIDNTEESLIWAKRRNSAFLHALYDTERGSTKRLSSNSTNDESTNSDGINSFNANGFTTGSDSGTNYNGNYVAWNFKKEKGFFDVVKWEGDGSNPRNIPHDLKSDPGCIIIKRTVGTDDKPWTVWHKSSGTTSGSQNFLKLHSTDGKFPDSGMFPSDPTDTQFTISTDFNANGGHFVAYLFADGDDADAQVFGDDGDEAIVKCGSFTAGSHTESLGFEPQWLLAKRTDSNGDWFLVDNMRGFYDQSQDSKNLRPNKDEDENVAWFHLTSDGFYYSSSSATYIYMAIRRGSTKIPTDATKVFNVSNGLNASAGGKAFNTSFPVDLSITKDPTNNNGQWYVLDRHRGNSSLATNSSDVESAMNYQDQLDHMDGVYTSNASDYTNYIGYQFKRAKGFFDIVCFKTTQSNAAGMNINHNLGAVPEMMIVKNTSWSSSWDTYHKDIGNTHVLKMNSSNGVEDAVYAWNDTTPTDSVFTVGTGVVDNTNYYIAYLFASCPGVSKVGSVTYSGSAINVDCGFTGNARFVLIKRTDDNGNWLVYDTTRGINAGSNDPFLQLDEELDEDSTKNYIDPFTTGFKFNASSSLDNGDYIYLAIA